ncbi:uncharacterized protein LOC133815128 [Humulus lupulus]|uniref:uncharacterized protein LOC133815128 n=1 Tax=Humulus lupulus TaxID=3486 RepID=UPI002B40C0BD|nr:uncharacterized protein LOC133815128 [Humulus lupulus]
MVLESGVVHFDRKPILLRPWSTNLDKLRLVKSVPVWIRLPDLGLQYWGTKSLSALVSTIGKPMMIDKVTKERSMVKFASVLVDVEISDHIPQFISFLNERGQLMEQAIEFEWLPTRCSLCKRFGYFDASCKRDQGAIWRKKEKKSGLENGGTVGSQGPSASGYETLSKAPQDLMTGKIVQLGILKETSSSKVGQELKWTTPKKVGGTKQLAPATHNLRTNKLNKIGLGAFLETKLRGNKIKDLMRNVFMGWDCFSRPTVEGRILLVWKADIVSLSIIQEDDQFIHCCVKIKGVTQKFCLTLVYGWNSIEERKSLWTQLSLLEFPVLPWLVVGDFNAVFDYDDRIGGRPVTELELEDGRHWRRIIKKLNRLKPVLLQFNKMKVEKEAYFKFGRQSRMYESFLRQRSKITWLRYGDENTSYFHASLKQRKIGNWITSFMNDAGQLNDNYEEVVAYFINHFKGFLGSSSSASTRVEQKCSQQGAILTLEQQLGLLMPFTKKDVKKSLLSIHSIKILGPDGYGSGFYKSLWKDIGDEISEAILTFFDRGEIPHELNNTIISLIPKVDTLAKAVDYRPIACCNTLYKCI